MHPALAQAIADRGYDTLTEVQEAVTSADLAGRDLLVSAQTGSGKTVGFGLAIADDIMLGDGTLGPAGVPLALIVAPTRELALQVMRELQWLYAGAGAQVVSCVGGMDMRDERRALDRGAHIVVGTPGRLRDHIMRGSLDMSGLRAIVLDEADEMLDLGFRDDLEFMLAAAPADRRTLMFSATVSPMIARLAGEFQRDALRINTQGGARQHSDIEYQALRVAQIDQENAIINLLRYHDARNAIIFANTRATVAHLTARLHNRGFSVVSLSGELSQSERTHALQAMRDGRARVCVATDVAARGIDLPGLELVIHADLPSNAEGLLHRSGRTGRAGRKGISALVITPRMGPKAERLLKFAKINAEWATPPDADDIRARDRERLLADPVWQEAPGDSEAEAAAELLAMHGPEKVAAAYLRLYSARLSAPEELTSPDAPAPRAARAARDFGPSRWFALSVGREQRAEPRWILPLIRRAANLQGDDIGAIRVRDTETFVEVAEAAAAGLAAAFPDGAALSDEVSIRAVDGLPGFDASPRSAPRPDARPGPRPDAGADRPARAPRTASKPRPAGHDTPRPPRADGEAHKPARPARPAAPRPDHKSEGRSEGAKPYGAKPAAAKPARAKPAGAKPHSAKPHAGKSHAGKSHSGDGPARPPGGKPAGARPAGAKPYGAKSADRPHGDKPRGGKPGAGGAARFGKPQGDGPAKRADASKPKPKPNFAADPSKRMARPGKPGSARPRPGGTEPPRRGKPPRK